MRNTLTVWLAAGLISVHSLIGIASAATPAQSNLIPNADVESADLAGNPTGWIQGQWGNLTASLSRPTDGSGNHYLSVNISNYVDGDAKWFFNPVAVNPNTSYNFADSYRSTTASEVVAMINHSNGTTNYQYLGSLPAAASWTPAAFGVDAPGDATSISIFHLIAGNGQLDTDNFQLTSTDSLDYTSGVPNASLEQPTADNSTPRAWRTGKWGSNSAAFSYLNTGRTGSHSLQLSVSNYIDGDAKWFFDPVSVTPGSYYEFSDYYKANVDSNVVAAFSKADGTSVYQSLPPAFASSDWNRYAARFTVPAGAVSLTVFHLLNRNGTLTTDDYSLQKVALVGFNRGIVSLTFDDGWQSIYRNALPRLNNFGFKSTQYLVSGFIGTPDYMTLNQVKTFAGGGHEIAAHTVDHADLTTLELSALINELTAPRDYFQSKLGKTPTNFATPYGAYNGQVIAQIQNYYASHRSVEDGYNSKDNFNRYDLKVKNITPATTATDIKNWVTQAKVDKTWLILVYHQVDSGGEDFSTTPAKLTNQLQAIKNSGITVETVAQALAEITPQL